MELELIILLSAIPAIIIIAKILLHIRMRHEFYHSLKVGSEVMHKCYYDFIVYTVVAIDGKILTLSTERGGEFNENRRNVKPVKY